jgi:hypothetical protein
MRNPNDVIDGIAAEFSSSSDLEVLAALTELPPLADENDECWRTEDYWERIAYRYLALADVASERRLRPAIPLLLDRACYGDPGETMRGLRHRLEAIVDPDWTALADYCLAAARSDRPGTRLWAIDQLMLIEDPRAEPVFQHAIQSESPEIVWIAKLGLERLALKKST